MPTYRLHYFPESGNSYKLALMLTLCGEAFEPVWTDFGWFLNPIPPNGINLNVPMSAALKHAIEKPTDSGDPETYAMRNTAQ